MLNHPSYAGVRREIKLGERNPKKWTVIYTRPPGLRDTIDERDDNLADAMAKLLTYLLENRLITLQ